MGRSTADGSPLSIGDHRNVPPIAAFPPAARTASTARHAPDKRDGPEPDDDGAGREERLRDLAADLKRILDEEARRHGIPV